MVRLSVSIIVNRGFDDPRIMLKQGERGSTDADKESGEFVEYGE